MSPRRRSLNGDALKQESVAEMDKLEQELLRYPEGGEPHLLLDKHLTNSTILL